MGRLIDADLLYKAMQDAEELARKRVRDTESTLPYPTNLNPAYTRYLAQMDERTKAKKMVADAPTVDAVPVRCKDCRYNPNPPELGNAACVLFYGMTDQMGFCHHGERREQE